ncbi:unnamed protein product, partial [Prunus brigantina]
MSLFGFKPCGCLILSSLPLLLIVRILVLGMPSKNLLKLLEEVDLADLSSPVSVEEIKTSVFAIGGLKTPGPDGFPASFYQKYWEMCSIDIITFVQECFNFATLPVHLNETLITLVPKVERPTSMTQIRPISLCNTLYKVVSKILVARL